MEILLVCLFTICPVAFVFLLGTFRLINEYERGVLFILGKYSKTMGPGLHVIIPIFQRLVKVDIRTKTEDLQDQEAITKDNVSTRISAVLYYKISDAAKSVIAVENSRWATSQLAETTMRTIVGEFSLDELLAHRDKVASKIEQIVEATTTEWGIEVQAVELKDVILPENMKRTIAKQAEAERERRATIISSEGEMVAAVNLAKAAKTMANTPGALHLRTLNSINDISSDQSNTVVFAVPLEVLRALEGLARVTGGDKK
ncbi:MAG: SPFH domain / Band 7 family protein [candidate division WS6 bacterium GW2011_GWA2_37_6]|uniref:SPFH domain / Band 7 family protein n=1 Tax=candidate division WS6 bacterium GW2011_GWA2_37_6 TaxID=1619087 RepID=A0A0G0HAI2_9BACT|nr:MAG: SPFH domain / Band 7 family protein [candidate division WS6 bacterium GW2011_GWA2_37_6]